MASIINNRIHFIWVGGIIPEKCINEIFKCLDLNHERYEVHLWTDKPHDNGLKLREHAGIHYKDKSNLNRGLSQVGGGRFSLAINYDAQHLKFFSKNKTKTIAIVNIAELTPVVGVLMHKYRDAMSPDIRNYGRASDILRLGILSLMGGIYMDTDVECLHPLPQRIEAQDDFLMGYGQAGRPSFTNAVMAASADSEFITQLMASILRMYTFWEERNWWSVNDEEVKRTRRKFAHFQKINNAEPSNENRARVNGMRQKYQKAMEDGTLPITGPTRVELFLYKRLLKEKARDPIDFFVGIMGDRMTPASFNEAMGQLKILVKQEMLELGVKKIYSFPMKYINIRSDASWM